MNNRIIIFGSKGFIASELKNYFKKNKVNSLFISKNKIDLLKSNSKKKIRSTIKKTDTIIFISSIAPVKNLEMFEQNIVIINNFINAVKNLEINHLIYISSDAVYCDTKNSINENTLTNPTSLHGLMHLTREKLLKLNFNKKLCILRPTLIYGCNDTHNGYGPNQFIRLTKKNYDIKIFGKGEEKRDHVFINDVTQIIYKCATIKYIGILNIASGKIISFNSLANLLLKIANSKSKIKYIKREGPMPHLGLRKFNISKTKKIFKNFNYKDIKKIVYKIYKDY